MGIANNLEEISENFEIEGNKMPDYHNDPNVIAMVERARAFLKRVGLPKNWVKKKDN